MKTLITGDIIYTICGSAIVSNYSTKKFKDSKKAIHAGKNFVAKNKGSRYLIQESYSGKIYYN